MKILVFSDSHGTVFTMRQAILAHPDATLAVYLGDGIRDTAILDDHPRMARIRVLGNCDNRYAAASVGAEVQEEAVFTLEGVRFLALHGHTVHAKLGDGGLVSRAAAVGADAVLFGHTHTAVNRYVPHPREEGRTILLFNPGTAGGLSYGVIEVQDGVLCTSHGTIE